MHAALKEGFSRESLLIGQLLGPTVEAREERED